MGATREIKKLEKILLPVDFTGASENALEYAVSLARVYKATLYVVHVIDTEKDAVGFYVPHFSFKAMIEEMKTGADKMLGEYCDRLLSDRCPGYEKRVLDGAPAPVILDFVTDNNIDAVVMGTFGGGAIDKFFFGSTTERVTKSIGCPVLIVPPAG